MNAPLIREFRLSQPGVGEGISCTSHGAFIGPVALLKRTQAVGREVWQARDTDDLSHELSEHFGLPIDISAKSAGLDAIARSLNDDNVARAQFVALHLQFPPSPRLAENVSPQSALIKFIRELHLGRFIKTNWDSEQHPRWPAGATDSQGGRFAPKDEDVEGQTSLTETGRELPLSSRDVQFVPGPDAGGRDAGLIEIAANINREQVCREVAAVGCMAGITATTPAAAGATCAATGPACPAGATIAGTVTALGSCIIGGAAAYATCHGANASNPDRPTDRAIKDQCIQRCSPLLD